MQKSMMQVEKPVQKNQNRVDAEARQWFIRISSGEAQANDREQFEQWCHADSRHREAYQQLEGVWQGLADLGRMPVAESLRRSVQETAFERLFNKMQEAVAWLIKPVPAAMALGAVAVLALSVVFQAGLFTPFNSDSPLASGSATTEIAEVRDQVLADGSLVTLGARSRIYVSITESARRVVLSEGQAFFSVAKDVARPFVVEANDTEIQVLGTVFDVNLNTEAVRIAVLEGKIQVVPEAIGDTSMPEPEHQAVLTAGQAVISREGQLHAVDASAVAEPGAWRQGRMTYKDVPLFEVIADANRYYDGHISIASSKVKELQVSTAFEVGQIEQMLKTLPLALPVEVVELAPGRFMIRALAERSGSEF